MGQKKRDPGMQLLHDTPVNIRILEKMHILVQKEAL